MLDERFVILGCVVNFILIWPYIIKTLRGEIQPNRVSWLVWSIAAGLATWAALSQGVGLLALTPFTAGFVPFLVFLASFYNKKAYWKLGPLDFTCGLLALAGLALWQLTGVGNYAIAFAILADASGLIPTLVKGYQHPESEDALCFWGGLFGAIVSLLTIADWNFESYAFPVYLVLADVSVVVVLHPWFIRLKRWVFD